MTTAPEICLADIQQAHKRIVDSVQRTGMVESSALSELSGVPVYLKLENQQVTGSFKLRGATNAILNLDATQRATGVVGVSTGNHGRALAYAARNAGIRCVICMSKLVPENKVEGIRAQGADVRIVGASQDDAQLEVDRLVADEGMTLLPPFDHRNIIAGQGTVGLEMLDQVPDLRNVLVQVSGGGLISGIATALKQRNSDIRVVGVSMQRGAAMHASLAAGHPVQVDELPTLADSLGGGIGLDNQYTFTLVRKLVDEILLVSEQEIAQGVRHGYWQEQQIVEGAGAVGMAAILSKKISLQGPTVVLLSGSNIDMSLHHRIISDEKVELPGSV